MKPLLVYLHGLNSSSQSSKAIQTSGYVRDNQLDIELWIPDLPVFPSDIVQCLQSHLKKSLNLRDIYIIGSSLGGFLGTWLQCWLLDNGHRKKARLVLINPAVVPHERFEAFLGPQKNFHTGADWVMTEEYVEQLLLLETEPPASPDNTLLMVQTGDETLDYRLAVEKYQQCRAIVQEDGSHTFDHFETMLPEIFAFLEQDFPTSV
ncbi:YqiA/YcfP family alpha/beta fold hydrolase [Endozoicomonas sp. GU-1]|uniref:YqiA/YcfP family alpha/beta fold hydrolase n=1 Tax=Endozoicomonas sp. GU-1 TaxID=3009078 RepID=UPI0022B47DD6|nr:YqiA/YcfP family alpha/beta fold hydrolase [Endozoicomonas sp. GU-1]WBA82386.1 esterase [Endozoicomonas sp. GU-1]WBA85322.1 esterase [Endozoicomonas sp. GU-1]